MEVAIIGKKTTGKTTLFDILTSKNSDPFSKESNEGICFVNDERIDYLNNIFQPKKKTYAQFKIVDIPGVEREKFYSGSYISNFKISDALIYVIKTFSNEQFQIEEKFDPEKEIKEFENESIINDLATIESRLEKLAIQMKKRKSQEDENEHKLLIKLKEYLEKEIPLRNIKLTNDEIKIIKGFTFLSLKPIIFVINIDENELELKDKIFDKYNLNQFKEKYIIIPICCKIEKELSKMEQNEAEEFLKYYKIEKPAKEIIIKNAFNLLDLICFLTYGKDEVRAWPIKNGTNAKLAAGTIHSDIEKGFIKAEVIHFEDFYRENGNLNKLKEKNLIKMEGKEYIVKDGDMINFKFNL
jgi:hypothetical protein